MLCFLYHSYIIWIHDYRIALRSLLIGYMTSKSQVAVSEEFKYKKLCSHKSINVRRLALTRLRRSYDLLGSLLQLFAHSDSVLLASSVAITNSVLFLTVPPRI
jgi:hypothetical protein